MNLEQYNLTENINKLTEILVRQQGSVYTFFKDEHADNNWEKYIWAEHTPSGEYCVCHYAKDSGVIIATYMVYNSDNYKDNIKYYTQITMEDFMKGIQNIIIDLLKENTKLKSIKNYDSVVSTDEYSKLISNLYDVRAQISTDIEDIKDYTDDKLSEIINMVEDIIDKEC